ncbi:uncharacterized protein [Eulemur rufifrons]|uniref:uncharacterized protein isoform X2 n=1 Tax=Eulemur rufifrons TaxID=859984 RepID=UPI00374323F0
MTHRAFPELGTDSNTRTCSCFSWALKSFPTLDPEMKVLLETTIDYRTENSSKVFTASGGYTSEKLQPQVSLLSETRASLCGHLMLRLSGPSPCCDKLPISKLPSTAPPPCCPC